MDPSLKRRLTIAVIIIALVVIFLPIPFGNIHFHANSSSKKNIPPVPKQVSTPVTTEKQATQIAEHFIPLSKPQPIASLPSGAHPSTHSQASTTQQDSHDKTTTPDLINKPHEHSERTVKIVPGNLTAVNTNIHALAPVTLATAAPLKHHTVHHAKKKPSAPQINSSSVVVNQLSSQTNKPIYITQSALSARTFPILHLRKSDIDSANVAIQHAVNKNIRTAKKMALAWVVQLGSFADPKRTDRVVHLLREKGYTAFSYKTTVYGKVKYRVYVGPFLREDQAEAKLKQIKQSFKMSGYIHHFNASELR